MDRIRLSHLAHRDHPVACPFHDAIVDELVGLVRLAPRARVLDLGCGRGEWLLRVLAASADARGVGVDTSAPAREAAARRAREAGLSSRLELSAEDGARYLASSERAWDLILCAGADHALGGPVAVWPALAGRLAPGGTLLVAQGFWTRPPTREALELLGENLREELPLGADALGARAQAQGLQLVHLRASTQAEWDDYEASWSAALEAQAREHPEEDAAELLAAAAAHREGYARGYRGVLGFAAVLARRPG